MSPLPANLTRATKSALIDEVQRLAAELASANDLLAAIAAMTKSPLHYTEPHQLLGRIEYSASSGHKHHDYQLSANALRAILAEDQDAYESETRALNTLMADGASAGMS